MSIHSLTAEQRFEARHSARLWWGLVGAAIIHLALILILPSPRFRPYQLSEQPLIHMVDAPPAIVIPPPPEELPRQDIIPAIAPSDDVGADATIPATVPDPSAPLRDPVSHGRPPFFEAVDERPAVIKRVHPAYPELARQAELEGVVVLKVGVDEFGRVREALVIESVAGLDEAALEAIYRWRFEPARQRDVPVPAWIVIPIRFTLRD
ncbi:MAG: TonB family protein [Candidatus Eisenbacteria bacterium]|nr:TonB family protein [Candidatus Eisenbacteria bacterium]